MDLDNISLPKNIIKAFKDVSPIDEINKFLVGFSKAYGCDYLPHLKNEDSLDFIDIPRDKMLFGEICNLTHDDCNYEMMNPCYDYFCERLFGSRFDVDFIKVNSISSKVIDDYTQTTSKFINQRITKKEFNVDSNKILIYVISWTGGQYGDPWYFIMSKDDLSTLCESIFEQSNEENFSKYLCSRIAEYLYDTNVPDWGRLPMTGNISTYINEIVESRHFDEYHWWELD